jgi:hypothetical protein
MNHTLIDVIVIAILFVLGISWTVARYGKVGERLAFAIVAILSPFIAVFSIFDLIYLVCVGKVTVGPVPLGLPEAERMVAEERKRMFGGELREPILSLRWQRAYELELQREVEGVERFAQRILVNA